MKKLLTFASAASIATVGSIASVQAQTAGTGQDFSVLTEAVDYTSVITAIMTIAAAVVGVYLAMSGARIVLGMIRRT